MFNYDALPGPVDYLTNVYSDFSSIRWLSLFCLDLLLLLWVWRRVKSDDEWKSFSVFLDFFVMVFENVFMTLFEFVASCKARAEEEKLYRCQLKIKRERSEHLLQAKSEWFPRVTIFIPSVVLNPLLPA